MTSVLVIGGTDSSGGAGLTQDTAVATQLGLTVKPVVTAVTAQSDQRVYQVHAQAPNLVAGQIDAAFEAEPPSAVKIGMLGTSEIAETVCNALMKRYVPVVFDPVLTASSGGHLSTRDGLTGLMSKAQLITPNLEEAAALTGSALAKSMRDLEFQAKALMKQGARAVLIKGGHGTGESCEDHLFTETGMHSFATQRQPASRRGTGCFLATAIACHLAFGHALQVACERAHKLTQDWIKQANMV